MDTGWVQRQFASLLFATLLASRFDSSLCCDLRLRGLFGRSCQRATVPLPVPSWTPADRLSRPRSGAIRPTPIKSVRSSCGTPSRSIIRITPGYAARSRGHIELARSRRDSLADRRRINTVTWSKGCSVLWFGVLYLWCLTRRIGLRWEPTRAPRQGSKRNEGGPKGPPLFFVLLSLPL